METKAMTNEADLNSEMMHQFEAFKSANDARLTALEQGASDRLVDDKIARIDQSISETKSALDRLALQVNRVGISPEAEALPDETSETWGAYLRRGDEAGLSQLDTKSLNIATDSEGGYIAPPQLDRLIEARLSASSPMRRIASVQQTSAAVFRKPVSLGASANWAAETGARAESSAPTLSLLDFPAAELYAMPAATQALLDDAYLDVDDWLAGEVQDAFSVQESAAFVSGTGINQPKGFLSYTQTADVSHQWGEIGYVASGAAGEFASGEAVERLIDLIYAVKPQHRNNARFVMNRRTLAALRKLKDGTGAYIFRPAQAGEAASLLGYPVQEIEEMPDMIADSAAIAFGDFQRGYLIVDRQGARVLRDPYSAKPYVLFYTTKRVGGGVQNFDAIKVMKFAVS